ncbi:hypothetical protein D3C80_1612010 [compost metagenome]
MLLQPVDLFAAAAEDARIAALQAYHALALARITQHQTVDKGLRGGAAAAALADRHDARTGAMFQYGWIDQVVDHDDLGLAQCLHRLECQQFRVARTCAYQPDFCTHIEILC